MDNAWMTVALGEVAPYIRRPETPIPGKKYRQIGVRLWGDGAYERDSLDGAATQYSVLHRVEADDVIVNKIWARHGSVSVVPARLDGCYCSGEFPLFRPNEARISPRWIYWMTKTRWFWRECEFASRGTTGKNRIRPEMFASIMIPLPDRQEQDRIVAKLDVLTEKIEEVRKNKNGIENDAEAMLRSTFERIVKGVPHRRMGDIAPIVRRHVEVRMGEEYLELGIRSFGKGTFHKPALGYLSVGTKRLYNIEPGDLLFSNVFAWEGGIAVVQPEDKGRVGSHRFITCVPMQGVATSEFLCFYFLTEEGLRKIGEASPGGAGRNRTLGLAKLAKIEVPVPDYEKQIWFNCIQAKVRELLASQKETDIELNAIIPSILDKTFNCESSP
jgi:type I restriction enzyme S subunit